MPWQAEERRQAAAAMAAERAKLEEAALPLMLDAMWAANVLDIQHTVKAVCQEVGACGCKTPCHTHLLITLSGTAVHLIS